MVVHFVPEKFSNTALCGKKEGYGAEDIEVVKKAPHPCLTCIKIYNDEHTQRPPANIKKAQQRR
jgi:hypothetical protein